MPDVSPLVLCSCHGGSVYGTRYYLFCVRTVDDFLQICIYTCTVRVVFADDSVRLHMHLASHFMCALYSTSTST